MGPTDWIVASLLCLVSLILGTYFTKKAGKQGASGSRLIKGRFRPEGLGA